MDNPARRRLRPCLNCGQHIKTADVSCLHCGAVLTKRGLTTAPIGLPVVRPIGLPIVFPMVVGLLLVGCNKNETPTAPPDSPGSVGSDPGEPTAPGPVDDDTVAEPMYGVPMSGDDAPAEPEYGVPVTDDPGPAPEPEYGVPMTDDASTMEPE